MDSPMVKEQILSLMEENMLGNSKMVNLMVKEKQIQMQDRKRQMRQEEARLKQVRKLLREQPTPDDQYNQQHLPKTLDTLMKRPREAA